MKKNIDPMKTAGEAAFVDRIGREGHQHQYLRELVKNAEEAGATKCHISPEWHAVKEEGVYRLLVADNGCGMNPEEMQSYMNTLGMGSKTIGLLNENFGMGVRTSMLPWNRHGLLIMSWTKSDTQGHAVWMTYDEASSSYGLLKMTTSNGETVTVYPLNDPKCKNFLKRKPDFIEDQGTVFIAYGNAPTEDTFFGPGGYTSKTGNGLKFIVKFLNERFYEPSMEIDVDTIFSEDRTMWPLHPDDRYRVKDKRRRGAKDKDKDRILQLRAVKGVRHFIETSKPKRKISGVKTGVVDLEDGTKIKWTYRTGHVPENHAMGIEGGRIGVWYDNEVYGLTKDARVYRAYSLFGKDVLHRTSLIIYPPVAKYETDTGVFPDGARNSLKWRSATHGSETLSIVRWADEFSKKLPKTLLKAVQAELEGADRDDEDVEMLCELAKKRMSKIFRRMVLVDDKKGEKQGFISAVLGPTDVRDSSTVETVPNNEEPSDHDSGEPKTEPAKRLHDKGDAARSGSERKTGGGLPTRKWVSMEDMGDEKYPVEYIKPSSVAQNGVVRLAHDHPLIVALEKEVVAPYDDTYAATARQLFRAYVGIKVALWISMSGGISRLHNWSKSEVEKELWGPSSLMVACLQHILLDDREIRIHISKKIGRGQVKETVAAPTQLSLN